MKFRYVLFIVFTTIFWGICWIISEIRASHTKQAYMAYYKKNSVFLSGIVRGKKYIERNQGIIYLKVRYSNKDYFNDEVEGIRELKINKDKAELYYSFYDSFSAGDSVVVNFINGDLKIIRKDSTVLSTSLFDMN